MGVSFYPCASCNQTFTTSGDFHSCDSCGLMFCVNCFDDEGFKWLDEDTKQYEEAKLKACPICSQRIVTDSDLLKFVLKKLDMTRAKAEAEFRRTRNAKKK